MSSAMWFIVCVPKKDYESGKKISSDGKETVESSRSSEQSVKDKTDGSKHSSRQISQEKELNGQLIPEAPPSVQGDDDDMGQQVQNQKNGFGGSKGSIAGTRQEMLRTPGSEYGDMVYFVEKSGSLEERLVDALALLGVKDAVWSDERNQNFYQVFFPCESGDRCDHVLRILLARGIGLSAESTVGVLPCMVFYQDQDRDKSPEDTKDVTDSDADDTLTRKGKSEKKSGFKSMQQQFLKSVTARLTVAQVVDSVRAGTQLTFDYIMFVALASMIAALGLMENSSVIIVASMLISPLMGPILAGTFGVVIRDKSLLSLGVKAELVGLFICILIGFLIGLICGNFADRWGALDFPTPEMFGRGQDRSLWVGVLIALPSGAGVALSVLGGNAGSLVGVAISASLLPPAVNAGVLWGLAVIKRIHSLSAPTVFYTIPGKDEDIIMNEALISPKGYVTQYRLNMDEECAILGVVSLLLTIVNIICIVVAAVLVLKIKEVAPHTSIPNASRFWKQDIKIARDYNKTVSHQDSTKIGEGFLREWAQMNNLDPEEVLNNSRKGRITQYQTLQDLIQDVEDDDVYQTVIRYVPGSNAQNLSKRVTMAGIPSPYEYQRVPRPSLAADLEAGGHVGLSPIKKIYQRRKQRAQSPTYDDTRADNWPNGGRLHPNDAEDFFNPEGEFPGVQLRRSASPTPFSASSVLMRHSWQQGASPYSLWPTQNALRRMTSRFVVTPVDEPGPPLPPRDARSMMYGQVESNL